MAQRTETGANVPNDGYLSDHRREQLTTVGFHALLWSSIGVVMFPIIWMFLISFNQTGFDTFVADPAGWLAGADLSAYRQMVSETHFLVWFRNSVIVSIAAVIISIGVCLLGAYSIGRLEFRGRKTVATFLLLTQMFPGILIVIPIFLIFRGLNLTNSLTGLILAYVAFTVPFAIWMLRGFFENLPKSLEEAAMIDGSTRLGAVIRVIAPLSKPAIATTAIFAWITAWNEFVFALVLISDPNLRTLPPGLNQWIGEHTLNWELMMAGAVGASIPLLIIFFFLQSYIVKGLAEGAVKS